MNKIQDKIKDEITIENYYPVDYFDEIDKFSESIETPFLVIHTKIIEAHYNHFIDNLPYAKVYYAVKANPEKAVLKLLNRMGSCFDIASTYELDRILDLDVDPNRISYGNTIKKRKDIKYFYEKGVRLFVSDSAADLHNVAIEAPGSKIFIRISIEPRLADWPLSRKFGCPSDIAYDLIVLAKTLGLEPYGLSFHVGSQQRDILAWDPVIAIVKQMFDRLLSENNIALKMINLGGGFPAHYTKNTKDIAIYAQHITRSLQEHFGHHLPEIIIEPGRALVANAGVLISEVVLIAKKERSSLVRWVYTDVGKFSGLIETMDEAIKYPLYCKKQGKTEGVILAGPTCDSVDIMYEQYTPPLPLSLAIGDRLYWFSTGAYTTSYSAIEFNGFPPLKTYCI